MEVISIHDWIFRAKPCGSPLRERAGVMRRAALPLVLTAAFAWTLPGVLCPQETSTVPARREPAIVFKAGVELVTLTAAAASRDEYLSHRLTVADGTVT